MPYDEYGSGWDQTSPNVARAYARYTEDDPSAGTGGLNRLFASLFGGGQKGITTTPLAPPPGSVEGDLGAWSQMPPAAPQAASKPATKISSSQAITDRLNKLIGVPAHVLTEDNRRSSDPLHVLTEGGSGSAPSVDDWLKNNPLPGQAPLRIPVDLRTSGRGASPGPQMQANKSVGPDLIKALQALAMIMGGGAFSFIGPPRVEGAEGYPAPDVSATEPYNPFSGGPIGVNTFGGNRFGGSEFGGNKFGGNRFGRSAAPSYPYEDGGDVPGYRRGGYPQLRTAPIREFDSGGESYTGPEYGDDTGRSDKINARLSPREYVFDAETTALLGDGNPDAGAKKLDTMRKQIRAHKGKNLAKGKISPDAKPAAEYLVGNPLGDGLRRRGRDKG